MCGGFHCTRNALTALNILYIAVSFILIAVAVYAKEVTHVTNLPIVGGIIGCGVFLFLLSLVGLVGARKHHQVLLFFYMVILFILFVVQFSIACACLAVDRNHQMELASAGWNQSPEDIKQRAQTFFDCCGFANETVIDIHHCPNVKCCSTVECNCPKCAKKIQFAIGSALELLGWVGMFFSFTEFLGVWLTVRYRNLKDPRADPSAFL